MIKKTSLIKSIAVIASSLFVLGCSEEIENPIVEIKTVTANFTQNEYTINDVIPGVEIESPISVVSPDGRISGKVVWSCEEEGLKIIDTGLSPKIIATAEGTYNVSAMVGVLNSDNEKTKVYARGKLTVGLKNPATENNFTDYVIGDKKVTINIASGIDTETLKSRIVSIYKKTGTLQTLITSYECKEADSREITNGIEYDTDYVICVYEVLKDGTAYNLLKKEIHVGEDMISPGAVTMIDEGCSSTVDSITLKWTNPADADIAKIVVEAKADEHETRKVEITDADKLGANAEVTCTVNNLDSKKALAPATDGISYTITITCYDAAENHENFATKTLATKKITTGPAAVTNATFTKVGEISERTWTLNVTWTDPADADFDHVTINGSSVAKGVQAKQITAEDGSVITIKTFDTFGNNTAANDVKLNAPCELFGIGTPTVTARYTGELVVTNWTLYTAAEGVTNYYSITAESEDETTVSSDWFSGDKIYVRELTPEKTYKLSISVKPVASGSTLEATEVINSTAQYESPVKPQIVARKIYGTWGGENLGLYTPHVYSSAQERGKTLYDNVILAVRNKASGIKELTDDMFYYQYWIVWPPLADDAGDDAFSLEAVVANNEFNPIAQRKYLYMSTNQSKVDCGWDVTGKASEWGYNSKAYPTAYVGVRGESSGATEAPCSLDQGIATNGNADLGTSLKNACFTAKAESTKNATRPENSVPWQIVYLESNTSYAWYSGAANCGVKNGIDKSNGDFAYTWIEYKNGVVVAQ